MLLILLSLFVSNAQYTNRDIKEFCKLRELLRKSIKQYIQHVTLCINLITVVTAVKEKLYKIFTEQCENILMFFLALVALCFVLKICDFFIKFEFTKENILDNMLYIILEYATYVKNILAIY